jgi:hypothetical protein
MAKAPDPAGPKVAAAKALELVDLAVLLAAWSAVVEAWVEAATLLVVLGAEVEAASWLLTSSIVGGFWVAQSFWILLLQSSWPSALPALDWMQVA